MNQPETEPATLHTLNQCATPYRHTASLQVAHYPTKTARPCPTSPISTLIISRSSSLHTVSSILSLCLTSNSSHPTLHWNTLTTWQTLNSQWTVLIDKCHHPLHQKCLSKHQYSKTKNLPQFTALQQQQQPTVNSRITNNTSDKQRRALSDWRDVTTQAGGASWTLVSTGIKGCHVPEDRLIEHSQPLESERSINLTLCIFLNIQSETKRSGEKKKKYIKFTHKPTPEHASFGNLTVN